MDNTDRIEKLKSTFKNMQKPKSRKNRYYQVVCVEREEWVKWQCSKDKKEDVDTETYNKMYYGNNLSTSKSGLEPIIFLVKPTQ